MAISNFASAFAEVLTKQVEVTRASMRVAPFVRPLGIARAGTFTVPTYDRTGSLYDASTIGNDETTFGAVTTDKVSFDTDANAFRWAKDIRDRYQSQTPIELANWLIPQGLELLWNKIDASILSLYADVATSAASATNVIGAYGTALVGDGIADAAKVLLDDNARPDVLVFNPYSWASLAKDDDMNKILALSSSQNAVANGTYAGAYGWGNFVVSNQCHVTGTSGDALGFDSNGVGIVFADLSSIEPAPGTEATMINQWGIPIRMVISKSADGLGKQLVLECYWDVQILDPYRTVAVKIKSA